MAKTLLLQRIKCQNKCDIASAGDQVPKINSTLLLQGVNISTNLNNCDFASTGSRKIKNDQDLASAGDQVSKTNVTLLLQRVNISKL